MGTKRGSRVLGVFLGVCGALHTPHGTGHPRILAERVVLVTGMCLELKPTFIRSLEAPLEENQLPGRALKVAFLASELGENAISRQLLGGSCPNFVGTWRGDSPRGPCRCASWRTAHGT